MHGGVKVYRGAAAAARNYLDADRSRADDYYLTQGIGVARRFVATRDGRVVELAHRPATAGSPASPRTPTSRVAGCKSTRPARGSSR